MSKAKNFPLKQITCVWDFERDGGAMGVINLGAYLPADSILCFATLLALQPLNGGGGARMSFGFTGDSQAFLMASVFASFNIPNAIPTLVNFNLRTLTPVQIVTEISTADLTSGQITLSLWHQEPFP